MTYSNRSFGFFTNSVLRRIVPARALHPPHFVFMRWRKYAETDTPSFASHFLISIGNREAAVIFNNLPEILASGVHATVVDPGPDEVEKRAELALKIDRAMREHAPAGWKGDQAREAQVKNALFPLLDCDRDATSALFELVKNQPGY